jgi:hypothetical protein
MVCHWQIDSNSSALSSQYPQTLRCFPRKAKNIKHDRYFPQGLERSNPHENYPHTRATCWANRLARRLARQVALLCGGLYGVFIWRPARVPELACFAELISSRVYMWLNLEAGWLAKTTTVLSSYKLYKKVYYFAILKFARLRVTFTNLIHRIVRRDVRFKIEIGRKNLIYNNNFAWTYQ